MFRLSTVPSPIGQSSPGCCAETMRVSPTKVGPVISQRTGPCANGTVCPAFGPETGITNIQLEPNTPTRFAALPATLWLIVCGVPAAPVLNPLCRFVDMSVTPQMLPSWSKPRLSTFAKPSQSTAPSSPPCLRRSPSGT